MKKCTYYDPAYVLLQNKKQGEKKYQFKNGGIRQWGKKNKNEDQQNDWLKHLDGLNKRNGSEEQNDKWLDQQMCIVLDNTTMTVGCMFAAAYRQWLLCLSILLFGDI